MSSIKSIEIDNNKLTIEKLDKGFMVRWEKPDKIIESENILSYSDADDVFDTWLDIIKKK